MKDIVIKLSYYIHFLISEISLRRNNFIILRFCRTWLMLHEHYFVTHFIQMKWPTSTSDFHYKPYVDRKKWLSVRQAEWLWLFSANSTTLRDATGLSYLLAYSRLSTWTQFFQQPFIFSPLAYIYFHWFMYLMQSDKYWT